MVWHAAPTLRCTMGFLPGPQRAALLDADAGCRAQAGEWVWVELQRVVRHLRGAGARLVWAPPPRPGEPPEATDEWRQQRWLAGYLVRRGVAPPELGGEQWLLGAGPTVWVPEFGAEYEWGRRCVARQQRHAAESSRATDGVMMRDDRVAACECWEVVFDETWEEPEYIAECWDGVVGVWRGASTAALELPDAARVVHVTTQIGAAPMHCPSLRLPAGVTLVDLSGLQLTSLGEDAFHSCANLTSIEAPGGCSLGAVGRGFAYDTPQLRHVDADNIRATSIGGQFLDRSGILEDADRRRLQSTMTRTHHDE